MFKPQRRLSQNFLHDRQLVRQLVRQSAIGPQDTVLEIGSGQGIITQELAQRARTVLSLELDQRLIPHLQDSFSGSNAVVFPTNFLDFPLPATRYKVFSNPPFAIEGQIIRQLLEAKFAPSEVYLVVRREHALRWAGVRPSMFATQYGPWFEFEIMHTFKGSDFRPRTQVQAVLLRITQRAKPLLGWEQRAAFQNFVQQGYEKRLYSKKPTSLSLKKWLRLFTSREVQM